MAEEKNCFVIAPIGEIDSETRKRSDQVLKHVIKPAAESCGYKTQRADEIDKPGIITSQVIQRVVSDDLVIADLTERNPNVFYELAIRHAIKKPLVQIIGKGERIPFDVAGTRTIQVDHKDLDSVEDAKSEIKKQIKELEKDSSNLETPITVSIDLQLLRQSEKPEERSLADLVSVVTDLRSSVLKIESKIGTQDHEGLLDEVFKKINQLPRRIEEYMETGTSLKSMRRRFYPMMLRDGLRIASRDNDQRLSILITASYFKDIVPWIYELGIETYRLFVNNENSHEAQQSLETFLRSIDYILHSEGAYEMYGPVIKELALIVSEITPILSSISMFNSKETLRRGKS